MIGVFDSGFGGLSVLKHFLYCLPEYRYIYLGDNARAPYGNKSQDVIYNYTKEAIDFLFFHKCKLIIVACNTASSQALRKIQEEYLPRAYPGKRVLGVVRPMAEAIAGTEDIYRVGIIGTRATIESNVYKIELIKLKPGLEIFQKSAPLLVPLVEEGCINENETKMIIHKYLQPLKEKKIQSLILGCTHYPFLLDNIKKIIGSKCQVHDPGEIIVKSLKKYLSRHPELGIRKAPDQELEFFTTDDIVKFRKTGEIFLKQKIRKLEKIKL